MESEAVTLTGVSPDVDQDRHSTYVGSCSNFITSSNLKMTIRRIFSNCRVLKPSDKVKDKELANKLWNVSAKLCGFESEISPEDEATPKEAGETNTEDKKLQ